MKQRPFDVVIRNADNGVRHVSLHGELDLATVSRIEAQLPEAVSGAQCVVVDMSGLSFLDSTGIRFLFGLAATATAEGWKLRLVPGPPQVQDALRLVGLEDRLPFLTNGPPLTG